MLQLNKEAKTLNGRIIECSWDPKTGWHFMRVREDKSFPNSYTTAMSESLDYLSTVYCLSVCVQVWFSPSNSQ